MELDPQAEKELAKLAIDLAHDDKIGKIVKRRITELNPARRFADVETDDMKQSMADEFAKRDQKAESDRILAAQAAARNALTSRYDDKGIEAIEGLMTKHGISDYEVAARLYGADTNPANPRPEPRSQTWEMPKMNADDVKNPGKYALNNAYAVIDEIRGRKPH